MCETTLNNQAAPRDPAFTILKALAIIFVVVAHSGGPSWLVSAAYIFCVPVFFMCTGYFFNLKYLSDPKTYVWRRIRHLYCPFWLWSVIFLVLHNFFFWIGVLSEEYGNAAGGVTHPYSWHEFFQNLWSITFNMSGYDQFLCGAFWFFRTMFLSSLAFYALFLLVRKFSRWKSPSAVAATILVGSLLLALWKVEGGLRITGVAQGGYRELMALAFMGMGFLYRQYEHLFRPQWGVGIAGLLILCLFTWQWPSSMGYTANFEQFVALPLPAFAAFVALHQLSRYVAARPGRLTEGLLYIGDRTLYIFAFHLLAFKVVSLLKVLVCDLPWSHLGGHPIVHDNAHDDWFFLLYILAGVGLPVGVMALWKKLDKSYNLTWTNCLRYTYNGLVVALKYAYRGLVIALVFLKNVIVRVVKAIWSSITGFFKDLGDFIKASNPKDE